MKNVFRIGTRDSELALWQANDVKKKLEGLGYSAQLIPVKSDGDLDLTQPLYSMGITGIFTKTLDMALLSGKIDIAVHSMKDVPTVLPNGIIQAAVLKRGNYKDILVHKGLDFLNTEGIIATGSLRRKAQWLHRYPLHEVVGLRGNVNTRLKKLEDNSWNAAVFAAAGLERLKKVPANYTELNWMIPAPAQGAMMAVTKKEDQFSKEALASINHKRTEICTRVEREFLNELEGGCTAPIGALATIENQFLHFKGILLSLDGQRTVSINEKIELTQVDGFGKTSARALLMNGGEELMREIKVSLNQ
ncbi:hydroxymethylbilane synthase [uncultured Eudoraea sp.]|uniref:hydroxymethylbilane synthase n=1 Tax=uncultured Eudoraea sp. TaxID=1035614 RepID=UPI0026361C52|nr:hydroxymethylbilane synthase [uncultured Eudoraea sp.]